MREPLVSVGLSVDLIFTDQLTPAQIRAAIEESDAQHLIVGTEEELAPLLWPEEAREQ